MSKVLSFDQYVNNSKLFMSYFSEYISDGVKISYGTISISIVYDDISRPYVEALIDMYSNSDTVGIIFKTASRSVSFVGFGNIEQFFFNVKSVFDNIKMKYVDSNKEIDNQNLLLYNMFKTGIEVDSSFLLGTKNDNGRKLYKIVSFDSELNNDMKRQGITITENKALFKNVDFVDVNRIFDSLSKGLKNRNLPNREYGFVNHWYILFLIVIDIVAIVMGIFLMIR